MDTELERNIIKAWHTCTPAERAQGARWYPSARAAARDIARESTLSEARCAAIIAALSPRCQWAVNVAWARKVALAAAAGAPCPSVHTTGQRALAWRIATKAVGPSAACDQGQKGVGPKVARFWQNILGDKGAVTVDVWAARVAGVAHADVGREGPYALVEAAYIAAARTLGIDPRTLQAATWINIRGRAA